MPLYEYKCSKCGHLLECLQKFGDPAPKSCPTCHEEACLHKAVSNTTFQLKGGGWYKDLYGSVKPKSADKKSEGEAKTTTAKTKKSVPKK